MSTNPPPIAGAPAVGVAWFPEAIKGLIDEMREQRAVTRQLIEVLRDIRDELALMRERRRATDDTDRVPLTSLEALTGGT